MYVKEEFTFGEGFTQIVMCRGAKVARTRFWTVLVLSDNDEDSESEDELSARVEARGGEKRSKSIVKEAVPEAETRFVLLGASLLPYGQSLILGDAHGGSSQGANGSTALGSQAGSA
jgi:hypothetical protein